MSDREWKFRASEETVMMLGIFNPWTPSDTEVFKRAITKTGQVSIAIRQVSLNSRWTYTPEEITEQIIQALEPLGFFPDKHFIVGTVPNIVEMYAGPGKDYTEDQTFLDTPPPDDVFKTADLPKDPWAGAKTKEEIEAEQQGSIKHSDMKHEDWEEG